MASAIKEIEPFYQLHSADGALAEDSLALDYGASISILATITASGAISLIILPLAPLASETVFIGFIGECSAQTRPKKLLPNAH